MKLYEIDQAIEDLVAQLAPDPGTEETPDEEEALLERIRALSTDRTEQLQTLARLALDTQMSGAVARIEEKRLRNRRKQMEEKHRHLMALLGRSCGGEETDLGVATLSYVQTGHLEITDRNALIEWLKATGHDDCYRIPGPDLYKSRIKKLMDDGEQVVGAAWVTDTNCYLK